MKKTVIYLTTAIMIAMLTACSEKALESSSEATSVSTKTTYSSTSDSSQNSLDKSENTGISLVKTGDNTVRSSDGRIECEYSCKINNNKALVRVDYTNLSDEYMISNFMPSVYLDGNELAETSHSSDFANTMTTLYGSEVYTDVFEYDITDGKEIYLVLNVKSENATEEKNDQGDLTSNSQHLAKPENYTSDNDENDKNDFTFQKK